MFGKYKIVGLIGQGGMGQVYEAYDTSKDRSVALKVLADQFSHDQEFLDRFQRESRAAAKLQEPHVIPIHDWGDINGEFFIDMRLVHGANLQQLLDQGPLEPARAVAVISQIASALDAAHAEGLIHRDVKPANIVLTRDDFAYLLDFGIAEGKGDSRLTMAGFRVGSLSYMAPERFDDAPATPAVDIYSLACVLYEALTAQTPFPNSTTQQEIAAHLSLPPPRPSAVNPYVPSSFDEVIARGMAKDPDDRYGSAGALGRAAQRALHGGDPVGTGPRVPPQVTFPAPMPPPQSYPQHPTYPAEFTQQPWGASPPAAYGFQGPHGYGPPADPRWPPAAPPVGMPPSGTARKDWFGRTMIALIAVLVVAGVGVGVWLLTRDNGSTTSARSSTATAMITSTSRRPSNGSSATTPKPPPPKPRQPPPLLTTPDTSGAICGPGFPDAGNTEWVSHAGRGSEKTSCTFAENVLDAYLGTGPAGPALREVSAPGSVSCTTREADGAKCDPANRQNFLMQCAASDSPDWITCIGGVEARVYLY
jgi:serine/threonine-protein kinase